MRSSSSAWPLRNSHTLFQTLHQLTNQFLQRYWGSYFSILNIVSQVFIKYCNLPTSQYFDDRIFFLRLLLTSRRNTELLYQVMCVLTLELGKYVPKLGAPHGRMTASLPLPTFLVTHALPRLGLWAYASLSHPSPELS